MNEVFRRILVIAMVAAGALVAFWSLMFAIMLMGNAFVMAPDDRYLSAHTISHFLGGLALAIIPNAAIAYIALGYFKKPDSNAD